MAEKSDLEGFQGKCIVNCKETGKVNEMFARIIQLNNSNIKSQQRSEADLSTEEKTAILQELYQENPKLFLTRFGMLLCEKDLECFTGFPRDCEIDYMLNQLRESLAKKISGQDVKNRRYEALVRLESNSDYFTEHEMRQRCPLLYEQYIGQYMSDEEKLERDEEQMKGNEMTMSSFIFQQIDRDWLEERQGLQLEREECSMEEEEEEDEEDEDDYDDEEEKETEGRKELPKISDEEKLVYQQEFLHIMKQKFLDGLDEDFDYSKIDSNEEYDNLTIISQDAEDKYFDEEEPEIFNNKDGNDEEIDSDDDYLGDKILQKCCSMKS